MSDRESKMSSSDLDVREYPVVATMVLSGATVRVGAAQYSNPKDNSVWLDSDEQIEIVFFNATEARLLIAALSAAIEIAEETRN